MRHATRLRVTLVVLTMVGALSSALAQPGQGGIPPGMRQAALNMLQRARGTSDQDWPQVRAGILDWQRGGMQSQFPGQDDAIATALTEAGKILDGARALTAADFNAQQEQLIQQLVSTFRAPRGAAGFPQMLLATRGMIDVHCHLSGNPDDRLAEARELVAQMDRDGLRMTIVMLAPGKGGPPYPHDARLMQSACEAYPGRLLFLSGGGCLNIRLHQMEQQTVISEECKQEFRAEAERELQQGARGFGELAILHISYNANHAYECVRGDHPLLLLLADIAAAHNVPIDMHMDLVTHDMPTPDRLLHDTLDPPTLQENLTGFERLLDHNPRAKIIWEHFGTDPLGCWTVDLTRSLLAKHPNLYITLRIAHGETERPENAPFAPDGHLKPEWLSLFQDYPTRFMMGSDAVCYPPDPNAPPAPVANGPDRSYLGFARLLGQLPPDLAHKISYENAMAVYGLSN